MPTLPLSADSANKPRCRGRVQGSLGSQRCGDQHVQPWAGLLLGHKCPSWPFLGPSHCNHVSLEFSVWVSTWKPPGLTVGRRAAGEVVNQEDKVGASDKRMAFQIQGHMHSSLEKKKKKKPKWFDRLQLSLDHSSGPWLSVRAISVATAAVQVGKQSQQQGLRKCKWFPAECLPTPCPPSWSSIAC